jgi:endoribonuclease Dicer
LVSFNYLNYDFSIKTNEQPSADILFQAITRRSVNERYDMENLEILGDCFLKLTVSMSLYYCYPSADAGQLTLKKTKEISNENLYRLAVENNLKNYLYADKIIFQGHDSNWLPPGYIIKINDSYKYTHQKVKRKAFADMIEALIGAFLISSNYIITIKFMHWLGLNVIPLNNRDKVISIPPIVSERLNDEMRKIFYDEGFREIEIRLDYVFRNKGYLISAFTHPSKLKNDMTYSYER